MEKYFEDFFEEPTDKKSKQKKTRYENKDDKDINCMEEGEENDDSGSNGLDWSLEPV